MNEIPDLSNEVVVRTLNTVAADIPENLHSALLALVSTGGIYNGQAIAAEISKAVNMRIPSAN